MAGKDRLKKTAVRIGTAAGKLDAKAHRTVRKAVVAAETAKEELAEITKQVEALKKQLARSSKRLQAALK